MPPAMGHPEPSSSSNNNASKMPSSLNPLANMNLNAVKVCPPVEAGQSLWPQPNGAGPRVPSLPHHNLALAGRNPAGAPGAPPSRGGPNSTGTYKTLKAHRRTCSHPGCKNGVVQGGVCVSHGAKRRLCRFPGCTKNSKNAGLCSKHGPPRKRCEHPNCSNVAVRGGKCKSHGAWSKMCSVDGCTKVAAIAGMCKRHNFNARKPVTGEEELEVSAATKADVVRSAPSQMVATDGKLPGGIQNLYPPPSIPGSIPPAYYAALNGALTSSADPSLNGAALASQLQNMPGYYNPSAQGYPGNPYNIAMMDGNKSSQSAAMMLGLGQGLGQHKPGGPNGPQGNGGNNLFY